MQQIKIKLFLGATTDKAVREIFSEEVLLAEPYMVAREDWWEEKSRHQSRSPKIPHAGVNFYCGEDNKGINDNPYVLK